MDIGNLKAFLLKRISKAGFVVNRRRNDFSDDFDLQGVTAHALKVARDIRGSDRPPVTCRGG